MTAYQIALIRASWRILVVRADALALVFYARLFEIDASAAALFAHVDMDSQRRKLAQALTMLVHALDDPSRLLPAISALGKRHTHYGVELHHFDSVGEALLTAVGSALGQEHTQQIHDAWADAYALVAAVMKRALVRAESGTAEHSAPATKQ